MKLLGNNELATRDFGDSLQFVLTRNLGWVEVAVEVILVGGTLLLGWLQNNYILLGFGGVGLLGIVINWSHGRETVLMVSESRIIARGNLDSWFGKEITLSTDEISSVGWTPAGDGDGGGVYVRCKALHSWILPGVNEEHGRRVISAIEEKFPAFPIADRSAASILFGDDSGITTLGLSNKTAKTRDGSETGE